MKELVARGKIEPEALIQYVIDGITDDTLNKLILYGTKKLADFKERLKVYEIIRKRNTEREREDDSRKGKCNEKNRWNKEDDDYQGRKAIGP